MVFMVFMVFMDKCANVNVLFSKGLLFLYYFILLSLVSIVDSRNAIHLVQIKQIKII